MERLRTNHSEPARQIQLVRYTRQNQAVRTRQSEPGHQNQSISSSRSVPVGPNQSVRTIRFKSTGQNQSVKTRPSEPGRRNQSVSTSQSDPVHQIQSIRSSWLEPVRFKSIGHPSVKTSQSELLVQTSWSEPVS